jgi:sugar phosphate isomerase/epimerase
MPEHIDAQKAREILQRHNLQVTGHTAWFLPIGNPSQVLRNAAVQSVKETLPLFKDLGAKLVTIHANWFYPSLFSQEECIAFQVESLNRIVELTADYGITTMLEPVESANDTIPIVEKILAQVPGLALHIDIGHVNLHGRKPVDFFRHFSGRIAHVHLHDNNGKADQHKPMGQGNIDWPELVNVMKDTYDGTVTLEIFAEKHEVLESKRWLENLLK